MTTTRRDTMPSLLNEIHERWHLDDDTDRRIARVLLGAGFELPAPPAADLDPMDDKPAWLDVQIHRDDYTSRTIYRFGKVDGFTARFEVLDRIPGSRDEAYCRLSVGCRCKTSERRARDHWHHGKSQFSGEPRPQTIELIEWCSRLVKYNGWTW